VCAKVAALPELKAEGLAVADFSWMMPDGQKAFLYAQYGLEGLAQLWKADTRSLLASGGVLRTYELLEGGPLRPKKPESSMVNQLLAARLFNEFATQRTELIAQGMAIEASLAKQAQTAGPMRRQTVWQRAGVQRGESELEVTARVRSAELQAVRGSLQVLQAHQPSDALSAIEAYTPMLSMVTAATLGALYGGARSYFRGWWQDVTPSVCRELAAHSSKRTALGALLLVSFFEAAPMLKSKALEMAAQTEVTRYSDEGALKQLVAIDCAYIGVIGLLNYAFPFSLVPWACNVAQVLILPSSEPARPPRQA